MIAAVIRASLRNRLLVILAALMMAAGAGGRCSARRWTRCPICLMCRSLSKRVTPEKRRR